jgi:hypothetical protein
VPVAYLLEPYEVSQTDPTNYWVFSEAGLRRLAARAGWSVLDYRAVGDPARAEPAGPDWRAWCLLRSDVRPDDGMAPAAGGAHRA